MRDAWRVAMRPARASKRVRPSRSLGAACLGAIAIGALGCSATLTRDGQVAFTEGKRGASVLTANGVEFLDRSDLPRPVLRKSAFEPWRAPTGFLLPADGVWRRTSKPVPIQGPGLGVVLRTSDVIAPSWGGEVLVRFDAIAPAKAFPAAARSVRAPLRIVIVLDGHGANASALATDALEGLGARDRAAIVDASGARVVAPSLPGSHRTLLEATADRVAAAPAGPRDLPAALALARRLLAAPVPVDPEAPTTPPGKRVIVLSDGGGAGGAEARVAAEVKAIASAGAAITAVATKDGTAPEALAALGDDVHADGAFEAREEAIAAAVPAPGDVVLRDVTLSIAAVPAPARVVEVSAGTTALALEADRVLVGDLAAGEARTEIARVALPPWTPGEPLDLTVTATYREASTGRAHSASARVALRYSNDLEAIAMARHGDVIAYASALAMVRRLDRAFAGSALDKLGGLRPLVAWQAQSLGEMARSTRDGALAAQAEVLTTLLGAVDD
jgi:hypothetical protein